MIRLIDGVTNEREREREVCGGVEETALTCYLWNPLIMSSFIAWYFINYKEFIFELLDWCRPRPSSNFSGLSIATISRIIRINCFHYKTPPPSLRYIFCCFLSVQVCSFSTDDDSLFSLHKKISPFVLHRFLEFFF